MNYKTHLKRGRHICMHAWLACVVFHKTFAATNAVVVQRIARLFRHLLLWNDSTQFEILLLRHNSHYYTYLRPLLLPWATILTNNIWERLRERDVHVRSWLQQKISWFSLARTLFLSPSKKKSNQSIDSIWTFDGVMSFFPVLVEFFKKSYCAVYCCRMYVVSSLYRKKITMDRMNSYAMLANGFFSVSLLFYQTGSNRCHGFEIGGMK